MKILGIGIDIIQNKRIRSLIKNKNFIRRTFGKNEVKFSNNTSNKTNYFAKRFTAKEALDIGLVNRVVPQEELMNTCFDIANAILKNSPNAIAESIKLIRLAAGTKLKKGLAEEAKSFSELFETEETAEGLTAFVEKRPPKF